MNGPQKRSPVGTGQIAKEITHTASIKPAEFLSNQQDKRFATLQAELALQGHTLQRAFKPDGTCDYLSNRWGVSRYMPTLNDVERFLVQIGGRK